MEERFMTGKTRKRLGGWRASSRLTMKCVLTVCLPALAAPALTACLAGLPPVHPYQDGVGYESEGYKTQTGADAGDPKFQGHDYCRNLEGTARANAVDHYR